MNTETKILGAVLIVSLVLVFGAVFILGKTDQSPVSNSQAFQIDYTKGQKIGSDSAKVKLVEFSDFQCPACKTVEPLIKQAIEKHQNDSFQFIYRNFPLEKHIFSKKAANFAQYAATQNKFWQIHDLLFETQEQWSVLPDPTEYFVSLGAKFSLDKEKITEAVTKGTYDQIINDDLKEGQRIGVDATPTFYLNDRKLELVVSTDLDKAVSEELRMK